MPVKKKHSRAQKTKLKPEQQAQEAAIAEIEEFLNNADNLIQNSPAYSAVRAAIAGRELRIQNFPEKDMPLAPMDARLKTDSDYLLEKEEMSVTKGRKAKIVAVKQQEARSPYLVNLKKILAEKEKENLSPEARRKLEELKKLPQLIKTLPAQRKEVARTISTYSQRSIGPFGLIWQGLAAAKNAGGAGFLYAASLYRRHQNVLGQMLLFNILSLIGGALMKAIHGLAVLVKGVGGYFKKIAGKLAQSRLVTFITKNILALINFIVRAAIYFKNLFLRIPLIIKKAAAANISALSAGYKEIYCAAEEAAHGAANNMQKLREKGNKAGSQIKESTSRLLIWRQPKFLPPLSWPKQLAVLVAIAVLLVIPLKIFGYFSIFQDVRGKVLGESEQAVSNLQEALSAGGELNFNGAAGNFSSAASNFSQAEKALSQYADLIAIANILPNKKAKLAGVGQALIVSGQRAAKIGEYLALGLQSLRLGKTEELPPLTERLRLFSGYCQKADEEMAKFKEDVDDIDLAAIEALDIKGKGEIIKQAKQLRDKISAMRSALARLALVSALAPEMLGDRMDTRYLIIFQNNAEMRASGGFIGSFALVDFRQGIIKKIEVPGGGSYDLQGGLHKRIASPEPMHLINSLWEFQDANWWPDWPASAKKIQWFFENGWGSSVDGVIALDPTFFEEILKVIGPVDLREKYGTEITADNFYDVVQAQAERKDTNKSKTIIRDLLDKIMADLPAKLNNDTLFALAEATERALGQKHLLLQFNNEKLQSFAIEQGWGGEILDTKGDYLLVINTNIAGGKSDRKIEQTIEHQAEVTPDGTIIDTVSITRRHTAAKGEKFIGVRNVDYLRVYVPRGSELLSASGFNPPDKIYFDEPAAGADVDPDIYLVENIAKMDLESGAKIYSEFKKTVFAGWTQVDPGQNITVVLKYKLPFKLSSTLKDGADLESYSLLAQKQAGSVSTNFSSKLLLPDNRSAVWRSSNQKEVSGGGWQVTSDLRQDDFWAVLIKK